MEAPNRWAVSPYRRGVGAITLGVLLYLLITAATFFTLSGLPGDWLATKLSIVPPEFWSPLIAATLMYAVLPYVIPLMQRLSRCRMCGKSTLTTSEHLKEWDSRANPGQHTAGGRLFWPERECSECHADLRKAA